MPTHESADRHSFDLAELCARHNLSRQTIYREISSGRLRTFKVGRRRKATREAEAEWIQRLEDEAAGVAK